MKRAGSASESRRKQLKSSIPTGSGFIVCWANNGAGSDLSTGNLPDDATTRSIFLDIPGLQICLCYWGRAIYAYSAIDGVHIILHGDLYTPQIGNAKDLLTHILRDYRNGGATTLAPTLRGSFILVIVDAKEKNITVITDRSGTKKVFQAKHLKNAWIGTSVAGLPDVRVDPAGLASLMSNDFCFGGRTLINDVSLLNRA